MRLMKKLDDCDGIVLVTIFLVMAMFIMVMTKIIADAVNTNDAIRNGYHQATTESGHVIWVK